MSFIKVKKFKIKNSKRHSQESEQEDRMGKKYFESIHLIKDLYPETYNYT